MRGERIYDSPKRFCRRDHDTHTAGRYASSNNCVECHNENNERRVQVDGVRRSKAQPSGDALMRSLDADPKSDEWVAATNRRIYKQHQKQTCEFPTCPTPVRYRSPYKPYCEMHGTPDKRAVAS